jgi:hypothetical protein
MCNCKFAYNIEYKHIVYYCNECNTYGKKNTGFINHKNNCCHYHCEHNDTKKYNNVFHYLHYIRLFSNIHYEIFETNNTFHKSLEQELKKGVLILDKKLMNKTYKLIEFMTDKYIFFV